MDSLLKAISTAPLGTILVVILVLLAVLRDWRWQVLLWALQSVPIAMVLRLYLPFPWAMAQVFVAGMIALIFFVASVGRGKGNPAPTHWLWRLGFLALVALVVWWGAGSVPAPWRGNLYIFLLISVSIVDILVGDDRLSSGIGLLLAWEAALIAVALLLPPQGEMVGLYIMELLFGLSIGYLVLVEYGARSEEAEDA